MNLEQRLSVLGGKLTLEVTSDDVLVVTHRKIMNLSSMRYLLDNIDPRYESFKQFSLVAAVTSVLGLILAIFLGWYGKTHYEPPNDGAFWFFPFISSIVFMVAGVRALRSRVNVICFNSHDGRRLFSLLGNKPSEGKVREFCDNVAHKIEGIRYRGEISGERFAEILGRHVDFLYEQNVLNESEVKLALERIKNKSKLSVVSFKRDAAV